MGNRLARISGVFSYKSLHGLANSGGIESTAVNLLI